LFCLPLLLVVYLLLIISTEHNPIFRQQRPGFNQKIFTIFKFKSMNNKRDINGQLLPDKQRITLIGNILRKTSIDELPQLFNVLLGHMSFVGPRPLLPEYLPLYSFEQNKRHLVKPGITGWAQVNGRNTISWKQKFEFDVWYAENQSFFLDLKIIFMTFKKLFKIEDVNSSAQITMEVFNGEN